MSEAFMDPAWLPGLVFTPTEGDPRLGCVAGAVEVWACASEPPMVSAANSITLRASNEEMVRRCCGFGIDPVSVKS
ncbi:MAG: hypothetical protein JSR53_00880 [Proteobacteria bacterium]|nr:hypothetical protein [Pseudomonadota bacterium]